MRKFGVVLGGLVLFSVAVPVLGRGPANLWSAGHEGAQEAKSSAKKKGKSASAAGGTATADGIVAAAPASDAPDYDAIYKIKDEGFNRSQVMEIESYLADVYGPRVTNSPNAKAAGEWTMGKMKEWKLENVHEETWPFGRGWSNEHMSAEMIAPRYFYLIAYPKVWTPGTNGPVTGDAVLAPMVKEEDFAK
ncbi:MAG: hypothetical protein WCC67_19935, partial [Candidatus Acidiferrales bacterium]